MAATIENAKTVIKTHMSFVAEGAHYIDGPSGRIAGIDRERINDLLGELALVLSKSLEGDLKIIIGRELDRGAKLVPEEDDPELRKSNSELVGTYSTYEVSFVVDALEADKVGWDDGGDYSFIIDREI